MPDITKMKPQRYILLHFQFGSWSIAEQSDDYDDIRRAIKVIREAAPRGKTPVYQVVDKKGEDRYEVSSL